MDYLKLIDGKKGIDEIELTCINCDSKFKKTKKYIRNKIVNKKQSAIFCSHTCSSKYKKTGQILECATCKVPFYKKRNQIEKTVNSFCSRSCATIKNNNRKGTGKPKAICLNCDNSVNSNKAKYCSLECQHNYQWKKRTAEYKDTGLLHKPDQSYYKTPKRYLIELRGHACEICNQTEWMGQPIPLVFDHIDGHSENAHIDNCRLVCGNCDMQLPTYKAKNKGNGRAKRRQRYADGKSY
jgi:hypothetical protein